jgi:adenylate cyclase
MKEPAHSVTKTILEMDLVAYSDVARLLEENLNVEAVKVFQDQIQQFVDYGLSAIGLHRDDVVMSTAGDNAILMFDDATTMHEFAQAVQTQTLAHNSARSVESAKRWFRMGAATGIVLVMPAERRIVGSTISRAVRLEAAAEIGQLLVDLPTFDALQGDLRGAYGDAYIVRGKRSERFEVRRCTLIDVPKSSKPIRSILHSPRTKFSSEKPRRADFDNRPAIAVLPFVNSSGDPDQQHFADGITDDIITELASWRSLPVIARGSTFSFRGRAVDIQTMSKELGARYILEGSIDRRGQRVRITAQLVDANTGHYLVAERYDRHVNELFDVRDEIVETIVGSIAPELLKVERERVGRQRRLNSNSYDHFIRGLEYHYRYNKEDNAEAQQLFRKAIEADPKNSQAHALLAHAMLYAAQHSWREDSEHNYEVADKFAQQAVKLDGRSPFAHFALGSTSMFLGRTEQALAEMQEVVRVNPSYAAAHAIMAHLLCYTGRPVEAVESIQRALRLSPHDPRLGLWIPALAQAHYFLGQYQDAVVAARRALSLIPGNVIAVRFMVAGLGQLGMIAEAASPLALLRKSREPTLADQKALMEPIYRVTKMITHVLDGLQKAGMT